MISGVAFCPHPPVLVAELGPGTGAELALLRAACSTAIRRVTAGDVPLVLVGSAARSGQYGASARGSLAGFGVPVEVDLGGSPSDGLPELPLSLTVGAWLVRAALGPGRGALGFSVGPDFAGSGTAAALRGATAAGEVAVLVLGDGSARRTLKAPGYVDARAEPFDAAVSAALRTGDSVALASLDADLGAELLAAGVAAWQAAGSLLGGHAYDAELLYCDDPYGVAYPVAVWTVRG